VDVLIPSGSDGADDKITRKKPENLFLESRLHGNFARSISVFNFGY
jgi:hypothetical protein